MVSVVGNTEKKKRERVSEFKLRKYLNDYASGFQDNTTSSQDRLSKIAEKEIENKFDELKQQLESCKTELLGVAEQLKEAVEVIDLSKQTLHLSRCSIGYEQYCDKLNQFLTKYRGEK